MGDHTRDVDSGIAGASQLTHAEGRGPCVATRLLEREKVSRENSRTSMLLRQKTCTRGRAGFSKASIEYRSGFSQNTKRLRATAQRLVEIHQANEVLADSEMTRSKGFLR
jgi:hypothetical protein